MQCFLLYCRIVTKPKGVGFLILCLILMNLSLFQIEKKIAEVFCHQDNDVEDSQQTSIKRSYADKDSKNPTSSTKFNWRKHGEALIDLKPALEWYSNKRVQDKNRAIFSSELPSWPIKNETTLQKIRQILDPLYNSIILKRKITQIKSIYDKELVLNCADIDYLEKRDVSPKLTYGITKPTMKKGELHMHDGEMTNVAMKFYEQNNFKEDGLQDDKYFNDIMETFLKLLKMQKWPGIPRVYAACITSVDGTDLMSNYNTNKQPCYLRYVIDRYDDAYSLCDESHVTNKCLLLEAMTRRVKNAPNSGVEALKIMRGFAYTFQAFELNGVFPYKFSMNDVMITKLHEVVFTEFDSFIFLEPSPEEKDSSSYIRVYSDVVCKKWYNCPSVSGEGPEVLHRVGYETCKEIKGLCGFNNRCWGLDAKTYLCVFSRWVFPHLHSLIPPTWQYYKEVSKLLMMSSKPKPEIRWDWTDFYTNVERLLQLAIDEWGE